MSGWTNGVKLGEKRVGRRSGCQRNVYWRFRCEHYGCTAAALCGGRRVPLRQVLSKAFNKALSEAFRVRNSRNQKKSVKCETRKEEVT